MNQEEKQQVEQSKEVKERNLKKLVSWGGWKKELGWVVFFAILLFAAYAYKRDIDMCRPYLEDPCSKCLIRDTAMIEGLQNKIGAMKEANKININDLNLEFTNGL